MKYVSIDIETTGLNPRRCQILQISAVFEDTSKEVDFDELPFFNVFLEHDYLRFEPYALELHRSTGLLQTYNTAKKIDEDQVVHEFLVWLETVGYEDGEKINVAGKNFVGFDKLFLDRLPNWKQLTNIHRRTIDPAILYAWFDDDSELPDLNLCMERADIENLVTHYALEDARDVVRVIRKFTDLHYQPRDDK